MEHYYTQLENISGSTLTISGDEAKHLAKVLRKKTGEEIHVTDGEGNLYNCKISKLNSDLIECEIFGKSFGLNEPPVHVTLYQSILKNPARFEFVIEKSVELGVNEIQPVITEHVINKSANRTDRWQAISLAAMKQSQRVILPEVFHPVNFAEAIKNCKAEIKLIAHEKDILQIVKEDESLPGIRQTASSGQTVNIPPAHCSGSQAFKVGTSIAVFIGPEGGFADDEVKFAIDNGFKILSLGKRKFRSETAAIAILSKLLI